MIEIFEGVLGGGKSHHAVQRILRVLAKGGHVSSNIKLDWPACEAYVAKRFKKQLRADRYVYLHEKEIYEFHQHTPAGTMDCPSLVVIDEGHLYFNARDWQTTDKSFRSTLQFLTQSRRAGTDIIIIVQHYKNLDPQFARLAQFRWCFRDMRRVRVNLGVFKFQYPWPHTIACQYDYDGKTMHRRLWYKRDPELFKCYDSHELIFAVNRAGAIDRVELEAVPAQAAPKSKVKRLLPWAAAACLGLVCYFWGASGAEAAAPVAVATVAAPAVAAGPPPEVQSTRRGVIIGGQAPEPTKGAPVVKFAEFVGKCEGPEGERFFAYCGGRKMALYPGAYFPPCKVHSLVMEGETLIAQMDNWETKRRERWIMIFRRESAIQSLEGGDFDDGFNDLAAVRGNGGQSFRRGVFPRVGGGGSADHPVVPEAGRNAPGVGKGAVSGSNAADHVSTLAR